MNSSIMDRVVHAILITVFCFSTAGVWAVDTVLFEEDFEDVPLEASIMEQIKDKDVGQVRHLRVGKLQTRIPMTSACPNGELGQSSILSVDTNSGRPEA